MRRPEVEKRIMVALAQANREIAAFSQGGFYARGLASEGYSGGYRDALNDVLLLLRGVGPEAT